MTRRTEQFIPGGVGWLRRKERRKYESSIKLRTIEMEVNKKQLFPFSQNTKPPGHPIKLRSSRFKTNQRKPFITRGPDALRSTLPQDAAEDKAATRAARGVWRALTNNDPDKISGLGSPWIWRPPEAGRVYQGDSFVKPRGSRTTHEPDQFSDSPAGTEHRHPGTSPRCSAGDDGAKLAAGAEGLKFLPSQRRRQQDLGGWVCKGEDASALDIYSPAGLTTAFRRGHTRQLSPVIKI